MKWIIGLAVLYYLYQKNPSGISAAGADVIQAGQKIAVDITGSPTTPANNSTGVATASTTPDFQNGEPQTPNPLLLVPQAPPAIRVTQISAY